MRQQFITIDRIDEQYWVVEARGDSHQTVVGEKIELLQRGLYNYAKIGKQIAKDRGLPFFKLNETPERVYKRKQRKEASSNSRKKTNQQKEDSLKQKWLRWLSKFKGEQEAIAEGIWACEQLARDLGCHITAQTDDYYFFSRPEQNEDLTRLCQFNELKNLWLKRNLRNISSAKKLPFYKPEKTYRFAFTDFYEDTFFSYFDNVQLYLYQLKIEEKEYFFFADKKLDIPYQSEDETYLYAKILSPEVKKEIGEPLHSLVPIIEYGARNFWQKYWSKKENKLLLV